MNLMVSTGVSLVVPSMTRSELCPALADLSVPLLLGPDKLTTDYVVSNTKQSSGNVFVLFFCFCFLVGDGGGESGSGPIEDRNL